MEREVGGGIGMGNTCKPMAVSFQCMTKFTTNKKKEIKIAPYVCISSQMISYCHFSLIRLLKMDMVDGMLSARV